MNKLCIATYVYGKKYQEFIPLYIISVKSVYPEYDIRIYVDKDLIDNVKKQLDILSNFFDFTIIEKYDENIRFNNFMNKNRQILNSLRWLISDESLLKYEYIYVGDIDIFICEEEVPLLEQHLKHCEFLELPYSNCIRKKVLNKPKILTYFKFILQYGIKDTVRYSKYETNEINRLTGLHFIKIKDYYCKVQPIIPHFIKRINKLSKGKDKEWNRIMFNNEFLLYELVKASGLGLPLYTTEGAKNDSIDYNSYSFRPHHGLHLGIFRSPKIDRNNYELLLGDRYNNYYKQFCMFRKINSIYSEIENHFGPYLNKIILNIDNFYNGNFKKQTDI